MALSQEEIHKLAVLARLNIDDDMVDSVTGKISDILSMVDALQAVNTDNVEPMANPLDATARLRADTVTESDQRQAFQAIAPNTEDGLYLVPRVID
jgi:aspartyl-tRNA(Asn)/glutamyl-tRNA(Gln) amidotransferase subunit C